MDGDSRESLAFMRFRRKQSELNHFLWTTELVYGLVKQRGMLERYPQGQPAWKALGRIVSEAWFPNTKGAKKYSQTIAEMRQQLDRNFSIVLSSVAVLFVAEFECYVQERFPAWIAQEEKKRKPFAVPAPVALLNKLQVFHHLGSGAAIDPYLTLRADLMKKIRNLYVHKGLGGVPRVESDPEIQAWAEYVGKPAPSLYPRALIKKVVHDVVGEASRKTQVAIRKGKNLNEEFFYALFTFTNLRNFAKELDAAIPF